VDATVQPKSLLFGASHEGIQRVLNAVADSKLGRFQHQLAGFDRREVQHVVQQGKQRVGGRTDCRQVLALLGGQVRLQSQFGHPDDAVHGRAEFVAGVFQKHGLGAVGRFGRFSRTAQLLRTFADFCFNDLVGTLQPCPANGNIAHLLDAQQARSDQEDVGKGQQPDVLDPSPRTHIGRAEDRLGPPQTANHAIQRRHQNRRNQDLPIPIESQKGQRAEGVEVHFDLPTHLVDEKT